MTVSDPKADQYARAAEGWTDRQYANAATWFERRAELLVSLGPRLQPGDEVLELACGDSALGEQLLARSLRYHGVDITPEMVAASNSRLGDRATAEVGDLNSYVPPAPVAATAVFRALYYIPDRRAFFRHTAEFTERKLMFDFNPRQYAVADVVADLRTAGLGQVELRPFFVPLTLTLPRAALTIGRVLERSGPLARLILRFKFSYIVAAWR